MSRASTSKVALLAAAVALLVNAATMIGDAAVGPLRSIVDTAAVCVLAAAWTVFLISVAWWALIARQAGSAR